MTRYADSIGSKATKAHPSNARLVSVGHEKTDKTDLLLSCKNVVLT